MPLPASGAGNGARETMIEVDHLSRYFGPVPALRDVTFHARRGEIVGFLGPNGAGKTTTMRILTGFMPPTSGRALIGGYDVVEQSRQARRTTGYLPENTPLYGDMTVIGYLDFMARLRGVADRSEAIERVMGRVGIDHRADDLIGQLSKGLRQRVGIAQALVHDPEVIILDEPTIGLDPSQIREVRGLIRELGGDHTIILSTHILSEAAQLCDRIIIINRGEIVVEDALERLAAHARHGGEVTRVGVPAEIDQAEVVRRLKAVPGIVEVEVRGEGRYGVSTAPGAEARPVLASAVVGAGWPLLELVPEELTLEDIFLQVTALGQTDAAAEAEDDFVDEDELLEEADPADEDDEADPGAGDDLAADVPTGREGGE